MNDIASDHVGPMLNPLHMGELIHEGVDDVGWNVTETAERRGCERGTLSRLPNGKVGVPENMALEDGGWGTADHWLRMQTSYELAQAHRDRAAVKRRAHDPTSLSRCRTSYCPVCRNFLSILLSDSGKPPGARPEPDGTH